MGSNGRDFVAANMGTDLLERARSIKLDIAFDSAAIGMAVVTLDGRWVRVNEALCKILGRRPEEIVGHMFAEFTVPEDRANSERMLIEQGALAGHAGAPAHLAKRYFRPDGEVVVVEVSARLVHDEQGRPLGYFSHTLDITELHRLDAIIANSPVPMAEVDLAGRVLLWNKEAEAVTGWSSDEVLGNKIPAVAPPAWENFDAMLQAAASGVAISPREVTTTRRDGTTAELLVSFTAIPSPGGLSERVVVVALDLTERRSMEQRLYRQAFYDPLTGLPNRGLLVDMLESDVGVGAALAPRRASLIRLSIEGLRAINDTLGEHAGDSILAEVARRLRSAVRDDDFVARLGGDDFAVLLSGADIDEARAVAERLCQIGEDPVGLDGRERVMPIVAGVSCREAPDTHAEDLLREAGLALDVARSSPSSRVEVFGEQMRRRALDRLELAEELRNALNAGGLHVFYQPILELDQVEICGAEALVRWDHPTLGRIPPDRFIPLAEQAGLIRSLGRFVLHEACAQAAGFSSTDSKEPEIHVNLSASELLDPRLPDDAAAALESARIDPARLVLELTETVLVEAGGPAVERLRELRSLGIRISLDDFGTGYSSLAYLAGLPVDEIKLDRSFVQDIHLAGTRRKELVGVIVHLAEVFGLALVAEGIERPEELAVLKEHGCKLGQGFLLGRPMPGAELAAKLAGS